jgi:hypothetical protein
MTYVQRLTPQGLECFRNYLSELNEKPELEPPFGILNDPSYSTKIQDQTEIEKTEFNNRPHMVEYLSQVLENIDTSLGSENQGLWSWLSLFYFDQVCPEGSDGKRTPGMEYRHIPNTGYRYKHRHLLAGPLQTFKMYKKRARLILDGMVHAENNIHNELVKRQNFITNPSIMEVADKLYFDNDRNKPKTGTQSRTKGGSLFRFINIIQQLELTFDLYSMRPKEILNLLPEEFNSWKNPQS